MSTGGHHASPSSSSSPSSRTSTLCSVATSTTHLPATREQQQQCPSVMDGGGGGAGGGGTRMGGGTAPRGTGLTVRELKKTNNNNNDAAAQTVAPPPAYYPVPMPVITVPSHHHLPLPLPYLPHPSSGPLYWSSTSSSPNSSTGLGKRRSSWSNLVQATEIPSLAPSSHHLSHAPPPAPAHCSRPPSYGEFFSAAAPTASSHLPAVASRQNSNASGSSKSGGTYYSKGSSAYFRFAGPPAPLPASAVRTGSALSSAAGGRISSQSSNPTRPLQPQQQKVTTTAGDQQRRKKKRDRMQELRDVWAKPGCKLYCLALLLLLIGGVIAAAILTEKFSAPKSLDFTWFPPDQFRAGGQTNRVGMRVGELGEQIRFELSGAAPFKSNFVSVFDFKTNRVAHLDRSLRSAQTNRQSVCFVMDLDRQNMPNMDTLQRATKAGAEKMGQLHGWQEDWHYTPNPVSTAHGSKLFQPEIADCQGARWIELSRTQTDQKDQRCSECFDFCLPDWGIERDAIRDEQYLNLLRRVCFHLFVPEWRPFAQSISNQQNQQDFEEFYRRQQQMVAAGMLGSGLAQPTQFGGGGGNGGGSPQAETRWVSVQTPPQHPLSQPAPPPPPPNVSAPSSFPPSPSSSSSSASTFAQGVPGALLTGLGHLGHQLFPPSSPFNGMANPPSSPTNNNNNPNMNLAVHSQFSPPELNGQQQQGPQQQQQQQVQPQFPPSLSIWNGWGGGGGGGGTAAAAPPPQLSEIGAGGAAGVGVVQPQQAGQGQQPQQQQAPTGSGGADQRRAPAQQSPQNQPQQQQIWHGKR